MRILFDQGTPVPLRNFLVGHQVRTAYEQGWSALSNGTLISTAESDGFEVLVTTDRNLKYQQNLKGRLIAIFVLPTTSWPKLRPIATDIAAKIVLVKQSDYIEYTLL